MKSASATDKALFALITAALVGLPAWTLREVVSMKERLAIVETKLDSVKATYENHPQLSLRR